MYIDTELCLVMLANYVLIIIVVNLRNKRICENDWYRLSL